MNPFQQLIASHRSVRAFSPEELDDERVARCVAAAQHTSTSSNVQAYTLLRVREPRTRARLAELCGSQPQVMEAGAFFCVCADQRRHRRMAERKGAPYVPNLETFLVAVIDASLFAQSLVLAFESEGLGICYIGGLRTRLAEVDELLELPDDVLPLFGLCVGRPAETPGERPRLPQQALLAQERYPDDETLLEAIDDYDRRMAHYYAERGKPGWNWSEGIVRKFREPRRPELADYYVRKGARLR